MFDRVGRMSRNLTSLAIALLLWAGLNLVHVSQLPAFLSGLLERTENTLIDLRFQMRGPRPVSGEIVIVAIDPKSVKDQRWVDWSRREYAGLLDRLRVAGARTVAFDILFTEPSGKTAEHWLQQQDGSDRALAEAVRRNMAEILARPVFPYSFFTNAPEAQEIYGRPLSPEDNQLLTRCGSYAGSIESPERSLRKALAFSALPPLRELTEGCDRPETRGYLGFDNVPLAVDGKVRHGWVALGFSRDFQNALEAAEPFDQEVARSILQNPTSRLRAFMPLSVAAVATHLGLAREQLTLDPKRGELRFPAGAGEARVCRFDRRNILAGIDYYGPGTSFEYHSFVDVVGRDDVEPYDSETARQAFADKLVFVGVTDPGNGDFFAVPTSPRLPGVELHASIAENLLEGRQLHYHRHEPWVTALTSLVLALVAALLVSNLEPLRATALVTLGTLGALAVAQQDFVESALLWSWTVPLATLALTHASVITFRALSEARARQRIRSLFSTYLNESAVAEILSHPDQLELEGERRVCSILFTDIVGFAALSDSIADPRDLVHLMNRYLGRMTEVILDTGGVLDKFIGHAILAVFGAPLGQPDHAPRACGAALQCLAALEELRTRLRAEGLPDIDCRVGIATGEVVVGSIGSRRRLDYTAFGDPVSLAGRLEGAAKQSGAHIVVDEPTRAEVKVRDPELVFRPLEPITSRREREAARSQAEPAPIFELVGRREELTATTREMLDAYGLAFAAFDDGGFATARDGFEAALELAPGDVPSRILAEKSRRFLESPPDTWTGVFRITGD